MSTGVADTTTKQDSGHGASAPRIPRIASPPQRGFPGAMHNAIDAPSFGRAIASKGATP